MKRINENRKGKIPPLSISTINPYHPRPNPPHTLKTLASSRDISSFNNVYYIHSIQDLPEGRIALLISNGESVGARNAKSPSLPPSWVSPFRFSRTSTSSGGRSKGNYVSIGRHLGGARLLIWDWAQQPPVEDGVSRWREEGRGRGTERKQLVL